MEQRPAFRAPAKINLYLHVNGRREDGYHLLDSLTVFAKDICDHIVLEEKDDFALFVSGPFSKGLEDGNLVTKALGLMEDATGKALKRRIYLTKNIPVGAGLGGGSTDAAAIVKAFEKEEGLLLPKPERDALLLKLGADVPVCYRGAPCRFQGVGDIITDVPALPVFHMLIVWPDVHTATRDVFSRRANSFRPDAVLFPERFEDLSAFIYFLKKTGNDLADAAEALHPVIKTAREKMETIDGCLLARMSGSGSSVFGIFENAHACAAAKKIYSAEFPHWWAQTSAF